MLAIPKRIFLFVLTNILIMTMVVIVWSLVSHFFGLEDNYTASIVIFSALFGMGGAFLSLWMSKFVAKKMMGVKIIDPQVSDPELRSLVERVHNLARQARLPKMPEVGIYDSPEVNAFATGPSKSNSLVAVSTGLLQGMNRDEVDGVLGHEVAHIANGDMVTMTLVQGIINTLVLLIARLLANLIASNMDRDAGPWVRFGLVIALQIAFGLLGSIVVNYFSRHREYRADKGGAKIAGQTQMLKALRALERNTGRVDNRQEAIASLKISGKPRSALAMMFSTHPSLEDRIHRLESGR